MATIVDIEDRNPDGRGRGHLGKRAVLVSQAHPGEQVEVRVDKSTKGTLQGRVGKLLVADESRISHPCDHEFQCTGCPLLATTEQGESAFKLEKIQGAAGAYADQVKGLQRPTDIFAYRHYAKRVFGVRGGNVVLGSYVAGTHWVADNAGCPVLAPSLAALMDFVAAWATKVRLPIHRENRKGLRYALARQSRATGKQMLTIVGSDEEAVQALVEDVVSHRPEVVAAYAVHNTDEGDGLLTGHWTQVSGSGGLRDEMLGFQHTIDPRAFFQVNPEAAEVLFRLAVEGAGSGGVCLEGYAGVGALTLPLAKNFERVVAVERRSEAASALRGAASAANLSNVEAVEADLGEVMSELLSQYRPEAVVLDPPRKGVAESVVEALGGEGPSRIVLLSCEPQTLERDLPRFVDAGYVVERIVPVDQFPRTAHVETVTVLHRAKA